MSAKNVNGNSKCYNGSKRWNVRELSTTTEKSTDVVIKECVQDIEIIRKHIVSSKGLEGVSKELSGIEKEFTKILPGKTRRELRELKEKIISHESSAILTGKNDIPEPTKHALKLHMLNQGLPFVGFGIMDNAILIWAGDQIDITLGVTLGISTMCAAAIGNIISDVAGVALGTVIEDLCAKLRLPIAKLTHAQRQLRSVRFAGQFGIAFGLTIGCIIGMFPLLYIDSEKHERMKQLAHRKTLIDDIVEEGKTLVNAQYARLFLLMDSPSIAKISFPPIDSDVKKVISKKYLCIKNNSSNGEHISIEKGRGVVLRSALTRKIFNIQDVKSDTEYFYEDDLVPATIPIDSVHSMLCVPVVNANGGVMGVIQLINKRKEGKCGSHGFNESDVSTIKTLASHLSIKLQELQGDELGLQRTIETVQMYSEDGIVNSNMIAVK